MDGGDVAGARVGERVRAILGPRTASRLAGDCGSAHASQSEDASACDARRRTMRGARSPHYGHGCRNQIGGIEQQLDALLDLREAGRLSGVCRLDHHLDVGAVLACLGLHTTSGRCSSVSVQPAARDVATSEQCEAVYACDTAQRRLQHRLGQRTVAAR